MSNQETLHGLACPNCGGMIPIPEGQAIVKCPYCELRSFVRGERGLRRHQVPQRVDRQGATQAFQKFLTSSMAIGRGVAQQAQLSEAFLAYLPFWTVWARVAAWAFGEQRKGSGDDAHYEPKEVRLVQDMTWNGAACDVGEFGVAQVPLVDHDLQPFDPEALHSAGMVFEPVGSFSQARQDAEKRFKGQIQSRTRLDRLAQLFTRSFRRRFALVYHPLWILRYLHRGRSYQVVVDGYSGNVLYGKAPGNTLYRAAVLVGGMAIGSFLAIDLPALLIGAADSDSGELFMFALALFAAGAGIMFAAYRAFRHGEQYEYRSASPQLLPGLGNPLEAVKQLKSQEIPGLGKPFEMITQVKDVEEWINRLN
ncbi:MAG: hypothetical protein JXA78_10150 [Anaerolineales bacterium]|nr:hypothetical protein [Anaerolineales bacterium]